MKNMYLPVAQTVFMSKTLVFDPVVYNLFLNLQLRHLM